VVGSPRPARREPNGQDRRHQGAEEAASPGCRSRRREGLRRDLYSPPARKDLPLARLRDRVLFETAYVCGARAAEVCGLYVEDFDLRLDDEHVRVHGKGGTVRTVLLDDRGYVTLLKLYLARAGYTSGPLFRASINGRGEPLTYEGTVRLTGLGCSVAA
jgi:integrase